MKTINIVTVAFLGAILFAGCDNKPAKALPPPEPAVVEAPPPVVEAPPVEQAPDMAVSKADVEKAAGLYKVLHDDAADAAAKQSSAIAMMEANGWTEDAYLSLLYDITQDPVSRAYYIDLLQTI